MMGSLMTGMASQMMGGGAPGGGGPSLQTSATAATGAKEIKMGDVHSEGTKVYIGGTPGGAAEYKWPLVAGLGIAGLVGLAFVLKKF